MKLGTDHHITGSSCLYCGEQIDGAVGVDVDTSPDPGDLSVCIYCGHIMVFADDLTLRAPTDAEAYEAAGDERILAIQATRAALEPKP